MGACTLNGIPLWCPRRWCCGIQVLTIELTANAVYVDTAAGLVFSAWAWIRPLLALFRLSQAPGPMYPFPTPLLLSTLCDRL